MLSEDPRFYGRPPERVLESPVVRVAKVAASVGPPL